MDRRTFLATATAVLAGCGQEGSSPEHRDASTDEQSPAETTDEPVAHSPTSTLTPTRAPAAIAVTDLSVPSSIEIGTQGTLSVTLENTGERSGSFQSSVEARVGTGEWQTTDVTVEASVSAGDTVTVSVDLPTHGYLEPASYRLGETEPVVRTRFVPRELALGEPHTLPNGVELTAADARLSDTYSYEGAEGSTEADPAGGDTWALATVRAENSTDGPARAPLVSDIAFYRGEEEYSYQHLGDNRDRYRGGELAAGGVSEGDLPANVPADAELPALRIVYSEAVAAGRITVNWIIGE